MVVNNKLPISNKNKQQYGRGLMADMERNTDDYFFFTKHSHFFICTSTQLCKGVCGYVCVCIVCIATHFSKWKTKKKYIQPRSPQQSSTYLNDCFFLTMNTEWMELRMFFVSAQEKFFFLLHFLFYTLFSLCSAVFILLLYIS